MFRGHPGARNTIDKRADLLAMLEQGVSTDNVIDYLDSQVFRLSSRIKKSGPDEEFKK